MDRRYRRVRKVIGTGGGEGGLILDMGPFLLQMPNILPNILQSWQAIEFIVSVCITPVQVAKVTEVDIDNAREPNP